MLDPLGNILDIVNNYSHISFNFGPTLLSWLEPAPPVYGRILEADRESLARHGGHGNAIAQAYNHVILPLADPGTANPGVLGPARLPGPLRAPLGRDLAAGDGGEPPAGRR